MDSFFDLFDEIDLAHIIEILINPEENKKVYNIYKNLKESANLALVASQVCEIKKRFVEKTGAACRRNTGGTNTQNVNNNNNSNIGTRDQFNNNTGININPINNRPRNARTGRGRGEGRGSGRGNHREGQIVNNSNVDSRQEIRNQVTQLANRQNPIFDILYNQTARQIDSITK